MPDITGKRFTTIPAASNTVYAVTLAAAGHKIDILNNTDGDILISEKNSFAQSASGSPYLTIPSGGGYNGLNTVSDKLYIKSAGTGTISVI